ncbi:TMA22 [Sanghuangporus sanghuang]
MSTEDTAEQDSRTTVDSTGAPITPQPVKVLYCAVCSYPPEYCEFGEHLTRCKEWLKENHPDLYDRYYSEEALRAKIGTLSLDAQKKLEEDVQKAEQKADKKADAALKKLQESQVIIKRIERNRRKFVTSIYGLEVFGIDLKKAAKFFGKKFATGSSVTKNLQGKDEIVIQGDVSDEIMDMVSDKVDFLASVPEDNVEIVEDKKKKNAD